jgi:hypothetical protein
MSSKPPQATSQKWLRPTLVGIAFVSVIAAASFAISTAGTLNTITSVSKDEPTLQMAQTAISSLPAEEVVQQQTAFAPESITITVYHSPSCGCCSGWIEHMQAQGFQMDDRLMDDLEDIKQEHNVPSDLASCHTSIVNGYVIEGHVPAEDVKRLLEEQPNVAGIAVPGMPVGTPGMEAGDQRESFTVVSFDQQGNRETFSEYSF